MSHSATIPKNTAIGTAETPAPTGEAGAGDVLIRMPKRCNLEKTGCSLENN
jgi:hypothetical protein